jgi:hypothetical protein
MRNRGFRQSDERGQVAHATLAVRENIYQSNARRIAEQFEDVRDRIDRATAQ